MHLHFEKIVQNTLQKLKENTHPQWGRMTPQHMVEHLTSTLRHSNGKEFVTPTHPPEKLSRSKAFMLSERPFPKNVGANPENPAPLPALRNSSLSDAIAELLSEIEDYKTHHLTDRGNSYAHVIFGYLNKEEWDFFHDKHFKHHFSQFGLIGEEG